jgi:hypothetical protein
VVVLARMMGSDPQGNRIFRDGEHCFVPTCQSEG